MSRIYISNILSAIGIFVSGCSAASCSKNDALDTAVMRAVMQKLGQPSNDALYTEHQDDVDRQRAAIKAFEPWIATVKDPCTRESYEQWIHFYNHELDETQTELNTHKGQREFEAWEKQQDTERKAANEAEKTIERPPK